MASTARGRCDCGAVQLEIGAIFDCGYCHCAICGSPVCYEFGASVGDLGSVGVGTLDDPAHCLPAFHQFASRRLPWLFLHDDPPKYADNRLPHPRARR